MGNKGDGLAALFYAIVDLGRQERSSISSDILSPVVVEDFLSCSHRFGDYVEIVVEPLINGKAGNFVYYAARSRRRIKDLIDTIVIVAENNFSQGKGPDLISVQVKF